MNTKGLGKKQRWVLDMLKQGHHISVHCNYSTGEELASISDEDQSNSWHLPRHNYIIKSFLERGIISYISVYSTVQPDTENFEGRLINKNKVLP